MSETKNSATPKKGPATGSGASHWLGPLHRDEPSSREIVDLLADSPVEGAGPNNEIRAYLRAHPDVQRAALRGLEEARRLQSSETQGAELSPACKEHHDILAIMVPPLRAAAMGSDVAPFPEDHRVLIDDPGGVRLSYFRRGHEGFIGLFMDEKARSSQVDCHLEDQPLTAVHGEPGETTFNLGSPQQIVGKRLTVKLDIDGEMRLFSYSFIPQSATASSPRSREF